MTEIVAVLLTVAAAVGLPLLTLWVADEWPKRRIHAGPLTWKQVTAAQAAAAVTVATTVYVLTADATVAFRGIAAASAAAWGSLAMLGAITDWYSLRIPRDATIAHGAFIVFLLPFMLTALNAAIIPWTISVTVIALVAYLARFLTRGGLGMGDVRLLVAAAALLSTWVAVPYLLYGLLGALLLQTVLRITAPAGTRTRIRAALSPAEPAAADETGGSDTGLHVNPSPLTAAEAPPRLRGGYPFGPSLAIGLTAAVLTAAANNITICTVWGTTGC